MSKLRISSILIISLALLTIPIMGIASSDSEQWYQAAVKDCDNTAQKVASRPGASWNSEFGWMYEDQCEKLKVDNYEYYNRYSTTQRVQRRGPILTSMVVGSTAKAGLHGPRTKRIVASPSRRTLQKVGLRNQ
jgi:hypothetical protein